MQQSLLLLLMIPLLGGAVPLLSFERRSWPQGLGRVGLWGLLASGWIDLLDNCAAGCGEDDSLLLSGGWAVSSALVVAAAVVLGLRRVRGRLA